MINDGLNLLILVKNISVGGNKVKQQTPRPIVIFNAI
jgi:hypothetical protein